MSTTVLSYRQLQSILSQLRDRGLISSEIKLNVKKVELEKVYNCFLERNEAAYYASQSESDYNKPEHYHACVGKVHQHDTYQPSRAEVIQEICEREFTYTHRLNANARVKVDSRFSSQLIEAHKTFMNHFDPNFIPYEVNGYEYDNSSRENYIITRTQQSICNLLAQLDTSPIVGNHSVKDETKVKRLGKLKAKLNWYQFNKQFA